jgi:hypothetical protein
MGKNAPKPPPAPDYAAAATAQGVANKDAGLQTAVLSNPNIISPYGNQSVTWSTNPNNPGGSPQATVTQTLTPGAQKTLEAQQQVQTNMANLGLTGIKQAGDILNKPFNANLPNLQTSVGPGKELNYGPNAGMYGLAGSVDASKYGSASSIDPSKFGTAQGINAEDFGKAQQTIDTSGIAKMPVNAGMTGQAAILSRLAPQIKQSQDALTQDLANQGITQGSEAYNRAMTQQGQQANDLYSQAALHGINLDMSANNQGFGQEMSKAGLYNAGLGQNFGQAATAQQMKNQAIGQNYGQALSAQDQANQAISQNFGQGMSAQDQANRAIGQNYGQGVTSAGTYNNAAAQDLNQRIQQGQFGNTALQQSLAQQLQLRNQPINEITALMNGSQIQNPNFQAYTGANVNAAPVYQATQDTGQWAQNAYNQKVGSYNNNMSGLYSLGGAGLKMAMG